jgi:hypothetical protein
MRVAVAIVGARRKQRSGGAEVSADRPVGGVELGVDDAALAREPAPVGAVLAVALDREDRVDAVRLAQVEVVFAVIGGHVDEAGPLLGRDEISGEEGARAGEEAANGVHRVAGDGSGEVGAFKSRSKFARKIARAVVISRVDPRAK